MAESKLSKIMFNIGNSVRRHSPELLTGVGIAGMLTTTVLAVRATPRALQLIEMKKEEEQVDQLTPWETVRTTWKCYIPAAVTATTSTACLIGASSVHLRRHAALATAYKLSETALAEYREKVIETVGERKERAIRDKVHQKHIEENPVSKTEVIVTDKGTSRCYDHWSGRYFNSDINHIYKAINEINRQMLTGFDGSVSLNDLYDELGLSHTPIGDILGWRIDGGLIEPCLGSQIDDEGVPCIVLDYNIPPTKDSKRY